MCSSNKIQPIQPIHPILPPLSISKNRKASTQRFARAQALMALL